MNPQRTGREKPDASVPRTANANSLTQHDHWETPGDAVQLSNLGGVLNAFATESTRSMNRMREIAAVIGKQNYHLSGQVISQKLVTEMLLRS